MTNTETPLRRRPDRTVEVLPYDPGWPAKLKLERELLAEALPSALSIEHIGSTSVPGLSAKPTLDILVVLESLDEALARIEQLASIGYDYRPGSFVKEDDHLFFRKVVNGKRIHHLHVLADSSPEPAEYRLFRDFLIARPDAAARYEKEKLALAAKHQDDRAATSAPKSALSTSSCGKLMHGGPSWLATGD